MSEGHKIAQSNRDREVGEVDGVQIPQYLGRHGDDFGFYPIAGGKSLTGFKQESKLTHQT